MKISRLSSLTLGLAIAVFALSHSPSFADKPDPEHSHGGDGEDPPPTIAACGVDLCIVSVGKWHRAPAREYAEQFGEGEEEVEGNYTAMTSSRFGEILGTLEEGVAADDLCAAFDVVIVEWSSPKIKNWNWQRAEDYMACGGGIIVEDPKNIEALAPDVATFEFDLHGKNGPLSIILQPVCVLTLGEPLNSTSCDDPLLAFMLPFINQHIIFNEGTATLHTFLTLGDGSVPDVVGLYGGVRSWTHCPQRT